jgi:hypothetical protein
MGSPNQTLSERIAREFLKVVGGLLFMIVVAVAWVEFLTSKPGHFVANEWRAMTGADTRVIHAHVLPDSIELLQQGPDSLNRCVVFINERFFYRAGTVEPVTMLPLREFALESGERFEPRRFKVQQIRLDCEALSRSIEPQD